MPDVQEIIERLREQAFYVPAEDADHVLRTHAVAAVHAAADARTQEIVKALEAAPDGFGLAADFIAERYGKLLVATGEGCYAVPDTEEAQAA